MLEHFHVPEEDQVRVRRDDLERTTAAIFGAMGMPDEDAALAADGLVTADIRGCEMHGVSTNVQVHRSTISSSRTISSYSLFSSV